MQRIMLVGASGTIGQAIQKELVDDCELVLVGNTSGDFQVDLSQTESIQKLYQSVGQVDAVVCCAARGVIFSPIEAMQRQQYVDSMQSKLLGQIDLVLQGLHYLGPKASFTLTTGILNVDPIAKGTAAAMINGAIEAFVSAAALDVQGQQRINVVSPALLEESKLQYDGFFPGYATIPGADVALAYRKAIMGRQNGKVFRVGW